MAKRKLIAAQDGQFFTRTTDRIYSHVVIGKVDVERLAARNAECTRDGHRRPCGVILIKQN